MSDTYTISESARIDAPPGRVYGPVHNQIPFPRVPQMPRTLSAVGVVGAGGNAEETLPI